MNKENILLVRVVLYLIGSYAIGMCFKMPLLGIGIFFILLGFDK